MITATTIRHSGVDVAGAAWEAEFHAVMAHVVTVVEAPTRLREVAMSSTDLNITMRYDLCCLGWTGSVSGESSFLVFPRSDRHINKELVFTLR